MTKPLDAATHFTTAVDELRALWPQLLNALTRDGIGPSGAGVRVSGGGGTAAAPSIANDFVLDLLIEIETELANRYNEARRMLGLKLHRSTPVEVILDEIELHRIGLVAKYPETVKDLDDAVFGLLRSARRALNLAMASRSIPMVCPRHRDNPTLLRVDGDEYELHSAVIAGSRWVPKGQEALTFKPSSTVRCPECKLAAAGLAQLMALRVAVHCADFADAAGSARALAELTRLQQSPSPEPAPIVDNQRGESTA